MAGTMGGRLDGPASALAAGGSIGAGAIASGSIAFDTAAIPTAHATRAQIGCLADDLWIIPGSGASGGWRLYDPDDTTKFARFQVVGVNLTIFPVDGATHSLSYGSGSIFDIAGTGTAPCISFTETGVATRGSIYAPSEGIVAIGAGAASGAGILQIGTGTLPAASATDPRIFAIVDCLAIVPGSGGTGGLRVYDPDDTTKFFTLYHDSTNLVITPSTGAVVPAAAGDALGTSTKYWSGFFGTAILHASTTTGARLTPTSDIITCESFAGSAQLAAFNALQFNIREGAGATLYTRLSDAFLKLSRDQYVAFAAEASGLTTMDTSLWRAAAGVLSLGSGAGSGTAWLTGHSGKVRLASAVTNTTSTLANLTELTQTVLAGRKYTGRLVLPINNALAADGYKLDLGGGTATMTSLHFGIASLAGATLGVRTSTALTTALTVTVLADTSDVYVEIPVTMVVNGAGTIIPRQAKNADAASAILTHRVGGYFHLDDVS